MVLSVLEDKNFEENLRENDKKLIGNLDRSKRVRKAFLKTFEIVKNMWESHILKTLKPIFDRSKNRFDRLKNIFDRSSINRATIELDRFKPNF